MAESSSVTAGPPHPPLFFEFNGDAVGADVTKGQQSWYFRSQNAVVCISWLSAGEVLETDNIPDEHALLVQGETSVDVSSNDAPPISVDGPAIGILPPGSSRIVGTQPGFFLRIFTCRATEPLAQARNQQAFANPDPRVAALPARTGALPTASIRVHRINDHENDTHGATFRTDSLVITWYGPAAVPADTDQLRPHQLPDLERISVTLGGEFVHHVRRPWNHRLSDWRPDEHVQVHSPSVTIVPPENVHVVRAVSGGPHELVEVLCVSDTGTPSSATLGPVRNSTDYAHASAAPAPREETS